MANWTAKLTGAVKDATGQNSNIILTVTFTNSVSGEIQTRQTFGDNITAASLMTWAAGVIATFNNRDATLASAQNAITNQTVLASG